MPGDKATGLSVSKEPLIVWRSEDSLRVSGEGLSKQQSKTLQTRPQSQLGLVWSGVPGGWGVEEKVESVRSGALRGCEKGFGFAKGIFHARMGTIKDRTGMDPRQAEEIKKRCQEYTELHKKDLHDPDNPEGVITHLEPDILECEVKWALGRITMNKASGRDGIPVELFQILRHNAVRVLHSISQ